MSQTRAQRSGLTRRHIFLIIGAAVALAVGLLIPIQFLRSPHTKTSSRRVGHMTNLKLLGSNLPLYVDEHSGAYPPPEKWCDELVEWSAGHLCSALRYPAGEREGCPYAMNPHADPGGPRDVVLLFESEPGWNRTGGPELLRVSKRERGEGAYVLVVGGVVKFVTAEEVPALRWDSRDNRRDEDK